MHQSTRFTFDTPMIKGKINYGDVRISGIAYRDKDFDIDTVEFQGHDILPIIKYFNADSVNECEFIYNATEAHVSGIVWSDTQKNWGDDLSNYRQLINDVKIQEGLS